MPCQTRRLYVVFEPSLAYSAELYGGLYNKFEDYCRVVRAVGSERRLGANGMVEFCPGSKSRRAENWQEVIALWHGWDREMPIPARIRG